MHVARLPTRVVASIVPRTMAFQNSLFGKLQPKPNAGIDFKLGIAFFGLVN